MNHHASERELLVGFFKKSSGEPSITWPESVDEALCFGWIDGVRKRIDDRSYTIRFTPRRSGSIWSTTNISRARKLIEQGRMQPAGLAAFEGPPGEQVGRLLVRTAKAQARATLRKTSQAGQVRVGLLPVPAAFLPQGGQLVDRQRQTRGHPPAAPRKAEGLLGQGATHPGVPVRESDALSSDAPGSDLPSRKTPTRSSVTLSSARLRSVFHRPEDD